MKPALVGADWLTRAAWGMSAAVHVGVAAAFLGWAEPTSTAPQVIAVSIVAMPSATGSAGSTTEEPPDIIAPAAGEPPATAQPERPAAATTEAEPPEPARPEAEQREPEQHEPAPRPAAPEPSPPAVSDAAPAETVAELPVPERKPAAPADAIARAPEKPADPTPAEPPAAAPPQSAALPGPPAPDPAPAAPDGAAPGAAEVTPASLNVAGLSNPEPEYPMTSRLRREEGSVLLEIAVSAAGTVSAIRVVESSGHSRLDRAALETVRRWRFAPARIGDRPIDAVIRHRVVFKLDR